MVVLEVIPIFYRRHYRFFHGPAGRGVDNGRSFLLCGISADCCDHRAQAAVWRPDFRLAVTGLHYFAYQRRAAVLSRHCGAILI